MDKEQLTKEIGRPITRPIRLAQSFFLLAFISTPFIWIWISFSLTWKVALTAIIGILITKFFDYVAKKVIAEAVEDEIKKQGEKKIGGSKFQKKLRQMMEENKAKAESD
jgi:hypothetical protein